MMLVLAGGAQGAGGAGQCVCVCVCVCVCANIVHRNVLFLVMSGMAGTHSNLYSERGRVGETDQREREGGRDRARSCAASERIECVDTLRPVYGQSVHRAMIGRCNS